MFEALAQYNTRVVLLGVALLGLAGGIVGSFMLLRKRSLLGDAVSHATLPGIATAFIVMVQCGGTGKYLPGLLLGALIFGVLGMVVTVLLRKLTTLREDAALGVVLSVFFGAGVALMGIIQKMTGGHAAGLESFIYGKTASMLAADAWLIGLAALAVVVISFLLIKEFTLLCFDAGYAASQGWPVTILDMGLMTMVVVVTVIGLQAVGLILIIALLIIPPAAARFWTERLAVMVVLSGVMGAASGTAGALLSAMLPRMPAGAIIVLMAAAMFAFSALFGTRRGLLVRWRNHRDLDRKMAMEHLLRAMFELAEAAGLPEQPVLEKVLLDERSWSASSLRRLLRRALRRGLVVGRADRWQLTAEGIAEARRIVRNHRLWELYLMTHADVATARVDRAADRIEHVLGAVLVDQLEHLLADAAGAALPRSPHAISNPEAHAR